MKVATGCSGRVLADGKATLPSSAPRHARNSPDHNRHSTHKSHPDLGVGLRGVGQHAPHVFGAALRAVVQPAGMRHLPALIGGGETQGRPRVKIWWQLAPQPALCSHLHCACTCTAVTEHAPAAAPPSASLVRLANQLRSVQLGGRPPALHALKLPSQPLCLLRHGRRQGEASWNSMQHLHTGA